MTPDAILHAFGFADDVPEEALRAAVGQATALAPAVIAAVERAATNVTLLPEDEGIVFYGLLALAAARHTALCAPVLRLLRLPEDRLAPYCGDDPVPFQAGILISVFDGDAAALQAAVEDRAITGEPKWALFVAAARLAWENRVPRQPFVALLDRFDRDEMALPDDLAWGGWQDAVRHLGLIGMAGRVAAGWDAGRLDGSDAEEREVWAEGLAWSAAHPDEPMAFDEEGFGPIDDPVAFLGGPFDDEDDDVDENDDGGEDDADRGTAAEEAEGIDPDAIAELLRHGTQLSDFTGREEGVRPADIAEPTPGALTDRELDWLARFLAGPECARSTMSLEMLDGFLTALAIGPAKVSIEVVNAEIWGDGGQPRFADEPQKQRVSSLLGRHAGAIATRAQSGLPPDPYIVAGGRAERPLEWAIGFLEGVDLGEAAWRPLFAEHDAADVLGPLEALADDDGESGEEDFDALPSVLAGIQDYWRRPPRVPVRSTKVGRNDPCPCGSGKKYKKCHGANA